MALGVDGVLLLSACVSLPIIMLCFGLWWTPLNTLRELIRIQREGPPRFTDLETAVTADDPLEWQLRARRAAIPVRRHKQTRR